ncbi:MAG: TatD family nuclease-associated radical SAM protein [Desulfitobacteriaceae bacterium]
MIISYEIDNNLYVNITNKCPNACDFCIRYVEDAFNHDLWLEREPTSEEIIKDIFSRNLSQYKQLVFCGFGEPLENIDEVLKVCKEVKEKSNIHIRINTNGLANKIHNADVTPRFKSLVDSISISLNARNAEEYDSICHSVFGKEAFPAILDFTQKCKAYLDDVQFSVVDCLPQDHIEECQKIADDLGVKLKIRKEVT